MRHKPFGCRPSPRPPVERSSSYAQDPQDPQAGLRWAERKRGEGGMIKRNGNGEKEVRKKEKGGGEGSHNSIQTQTQNCTEQNDLIHTH